MDFSFVSFTHISYIFKIIPATQKRIKNIFVQRIKLLNFPDFPFKEKKKVLEIYEAQMMLSPAMYTKLCVLTT